MRTPKTIWRIYNRLGASWDPASTTIRALQGCTCPVQWDEHFPHASPHRVVKYVLNQSKTAKTQEARLVPRNAG